MVIDRFAVFLVSIFLLVLFNNMFTKEIFLGVEFLSDKFFIKMFCIEYREYKAIILLGPEIGMLRWSFTDQQVSYLCRFPENVNQL